MKSLIIMFICCTYLLHGQSYYDKNRDYSGIESFGFHLGTNYTTYIGDATLNGDRDYLDSQDAPKDISFKSGLHFGISWNRTIADIFDIQLELNLTQFGANYQVMDTDVSEKLTQVCQIPVIFKYFITEDNKSKTAAYLGPYFGLTMSDQSDIGSKSISDGKGHGDWGILLGGCYYYDINFANTHVSADLRVTYGMSDLYGYNLTNFGVSLIGGLILR